MSVDLLRRLAALLIWPLVWLRWFTPLVGIQWRHERRWLNGIRCAHCDLIRLDAGPDPCLGSLPGVVFACCGHGQRRYAYVQFRSGVTIRGFDKVQGDP